MPNLNVFIVINVTENWQHSNDCLEYYFLKILVCPNYTNYRHRTLKLLLSSVAHLNARWYSHFLPINILNFSIFHSASNWIKMSYIVFQFRETMLLSLSWTRLDNSSLRSSNSKVWLNEHRYNLLEFIWLGNEMLLN